MDKKKRTPKKSTSGAAAVLGDITERLMSACPGVTEPRLNVLYTLGDAQFVCWQWVKPDLRREIFSKETKEQLDLLLQNRFCKRSFELFKNYALACRIQPRMDKYRDLLNQCILAYEADSYDLVVVGVCFIIDCFLSDLSAEDSTDSIISRLKAVRERLERGEIGATDREKVIIFTLLITVSRAIVPYDDRQDLSGKEPAYLNRHRIMQGRSRRKKTPLDCQKLIQLLYGLLVLSRYIPDEMLDLSKIAKHGPKVYHLTAINHSTPPDENE